LSFGYRYRRRQIIPRHPTVDDILINENIGPLSVDLESKPGHHTNDFEDYAPRQLVPLAIERLRGYGEIPGRGLSTGVYEKI
jgi:hypothetical protein